MITVLMATLREAEPRRPVTGSLRDSLAQNIDDKGIQISIFRAGALVKKFSAGGNVSKTQSYYKEEETGNVYLMTIPGYRVYVSGILELDENGWRNKYVFGFNSQNFQGLKAEFPGKPAENFNVSFIDNLFVIEGLPKTDTAKLYTYLDNVLTLTASEYVSSSRLTDSLLSLKPQLIITVTDIAKRDYVLKLYPPQGEEIPGILMKIRRFCSIRERFASGSSKVIFCTPVAFLLLFEFVIRVLKFRFLYNFTPL
jgi:hypothetical protein